MCGCSKRFKRALKICANRFQQQTATADVLKVISRSAFDLSLYLPTLVASAARLCDAERGLIFLRQDDHFRMATNYGFSPELEEFARANPFPVDSASTTIRAAISGSAVQAFDVLADETQGWLAREYQQLGGHRTNLGVPLRRDGETIGVFTLTRQVVRPFTEKQIELVSYFCRSGRDRYRERAALRRGKGAYRGLKQIAAAADRDRRRAEGDQPLDLRLEGRASNASNQLQSFARPTTQ